MLSPAQNQTTKIEWQSFESAIKSNESYPKKKIFIDLYTDWCGWCKKMDAETFVDPGVVEYMSQHFRAVKMDAERKDTVEYMGHAFVNENPGGRRQAHQLAVALLNGRMSYPSYVILDEQNHKLTQIPGYMKAPELMLILEYFADNHHIQMSWDTFRSNRKNQ